MIPMYAPFLVLAGVCAFCPQPSWVRRVDWVKLTWWLVYLLFCVVFWVSLYEFAVWVTA